MLGESRFESVGRLFTKRRRCENPDVRTEIHEIDDGSFR